MKRILFITISIVMLWSCKPASELPPLSEGYATTFIMPDPVELTSADREYINDLKDEYNKATGK